MFSSTVIILPLCSPRPCTGGLESRRVLMLRTCSATEQSRALCLHFPIEFKRDSTSPVLVDLFTNLALECGFAFIAFDLVTFSPCLYVGPVFPRPTVFTTFLSLPFDNFVVHHCEFASCSYCLAFIKLVRSVGLYIFLKKIKFRKILTNTLQRCFLLYPCSVNGRWLLGFLSQHWDSGAFKHSRFLFPFCVSV